MTRQYKDITYELRRSRRKTASIYIERNGAVSVIVPQFLSDERIDRVLELKRRQIYKGLAEWESLNNRRYEREFVNGESFLYLGRQHRLRLVPDLEVPLVLKQGYFNIRARMSPVPLARARGLFRTFYRVQGQAWVVRRIAHFAGRMGLTVPAVKVLELRNHWASCSATGCINVNWRTMMAPPTVVDYILVHELAHLSYPTHTAAFWGAVDRVLPDYREQRAWLREHGAELDL
jgi:predicted metal-dependent hydrolase